MSWVKWPLCWPLVQDRHGELNRHLSWMLSSPKRCPRIPLLNRSSCAVFLGKWVHDSLDKIQGGQKLSFEKRNWWKVSEEEESIDVQQKTCEGKELSHPGKQLNISKSHHLSLDRGKFPSRKIQPPHHSAQTNPIYQEQSLKSSLILPAQILSSKATWTLKKPLICRDKIHGLPWQPNLIQRWGCSLGLWLFVSVSLSHSAADK